MPLRCSGDAGTEAPQDELSSGTAGSLRSTLDEVQQRVNVRDCSGASRQAASFREQVDALPDRVDAKLRQALSSSADRLETLVNSQCTAEPAAPTEQPPAGATSEGQTQAPQKEKAPKKDQTKTKTQTQTQTEPPPDTGGAGEQVPGAGDQGGGTPPGG